MEHMASRLICLIFALVGVSGFAGAGFYRMEKRSDGWTVLDPAGRAELLLGVDQVKWDGMPCEKMNWRRPYEEHNAAQYASRKEWEDESLSRLKAWGFNMLGACCDDSLRHRGLAHAIFLNVSEGFCIGDDDRWISEYKGVPNTAMPNVFHPDYAVHCDLVAREMCAPNRGDADLLGYYIDNELVWQGMRGASMDTGLFDSVRGKSEGHSARRALMAFLGERGIVDWTAFDALPDGRRKEIKAAFLDFAAERYFKVTTEAIRRHDPNHLILGCRFAGLDGAPLAVWKAAGRFCDVITFNCYPWADIDRNIVLDAKGGTSLVSRLAAVHALTGKPLLVTEWSFPALDAGRPCLNGAGQRFKTQTERVQASALFARTLLSRPYVLGYSYFMWVDQPVLGTNGENPEDSNYGLVSEDGVPYAGLTDMFARLHAEVRGGTKRPAMPKGRNAPPSANRSTADIFRSGAHGAPADVRFIRDGGNWEITNAAGLSLRGKIGGTNMIDEVLVGSALYGRYNGMLQLIAPNGESHWALSDCVTSVKYEQTGVCGSVHLFATGRAAEQAFLLEHRVTVAPERTDFLCEVVGVENTGHSTFSVKRFYLCPFAAEERPSVQKGVPNLWKGDRECYWKLSDGRSYGMVSSDCAAEWFNLWIDAEGRQHPDIDFVPETPVVMALGARYAPSTPMGARAVPALAAPVGKPLDAAAETNLVRRAWAALDGNVVTGDGVQWSPLRGIEPSNSFFFGVWNWDSAFHALAVVRKDAALSRDQFRIMMKWQGEDGMFPDVVWQDPQRGVFRGNTKPPVWAWAVWFMDRVAPDDAFLREAYAALVREEAFWRGRRRVASLGMFHYDGNSDDPKERSTYCGWESGWDDSPRWDGEAASKIPVDLNCWMVLRYRSLRDIARRLGKEREASQWDDAAKDLAAKVESLLWDEESGCYYDWDFKTKTFSRVLTPASFMPLFIGTASSARAASMARHAKRMEPGWPSVSYDHPEYKPTIYWRGRTWLNVAYFALKGLKFYGYDELADEGRETILGWVDAYKGSIHENYDSMTGEPLGAKDFSWSAVFVLKFLHEWQTPRHLEMPIDACIQR